jgi:hypothetical protein
MPCPGGGPLRLAQLLVLLDGHDHRYHLAAMTNHVVGVTGGQFAHEGDGNEVDRQHDVTTRRRSMIRVETKASWRWWTAGCLGDEVQPCAGFLAACPMSRWPLTRA